MYANDCASGATANTRIAAPPDDVPAGVVMATRPKKGGQSKDRAGPPDLMNIYLREVGIRPLLSREAEVELFERVATGERLALEAALGTPLAAQITSAIMGRLHEGKRKTPDVCQLDERQRETLMTELSRLGERLERAEKAKQRCGKHARLEIQRVQADAGLPADELRRVMRDIRAGIRIAERARARIVESHLCLVISIAKHFQHRGLPLLDLVQEGNIGMMHAFKRFDHRRGYRFSTYAVWWIRQAIHRAVASQGQTIRVPLNVYNDFMVLTNAKHYLTRELGREPDTNEIAAMLGVSTARATYLQKLFVEPLSLDQPVGDREYDRLGDYVPDRSSPSPVDELISRSLSTRLDAMLNDLPSRHRKLLRMRFGIGGEPDHTLAELGLEFNVSRERARQIQYWAMDKLSQGENGRVLEDFLAN